MSGWQRNDHNGIPMRWASRSDGVETCRFCGTTIAWVRYSMRRIPYENEDPEGLGHLGWRDHRTPCRLRRRGRWQTLGGAQNRFATVRAPSARLEAAAGRAGRRPRPWKAMTGRSSRDESVAHVPATQAAGQTTGRAGAQATAPVFLGMQR
jgi:hypothetical protein